MRGARWGTSDQPIGPGDRVLVLDAGLAELRRLMRTFGYDPKPNHHGTVESIEGDQVMIAFDDGGVAPYEMGLVRLLAEEERESDDG